MIIFFHTLYYFCISQHLLITVLYLHRQYVEAAIFCSISKQYSGDFRGFTYKKNIGGGVGSFILLTLPKVYYAVCARSLKDVHSVKV